MSLTETSLFDAVRNQYLYKLKSRLGFFVAMAGAQVLALLFSLQGVSSYGMGAQYLDISVRYYSSNVVIWFTVLWIAIIAAKVTARDEQNIEFTFVSNRLSGNLANAAFLVTAALIGGITAILSGFLLRIIIYFNGNSYLLSQNFIATPDVVFTGMAVTVLYLLLFGSLGYFCGVLARLSKVFIVLLAGLFFVAVTGFAGTNPLLLATLDYVYDFFRGESSLALLAIKALLTMVLLYVCSFMLSNRLEVR
ncbi:MAG: hypothetical protein PHY77_00830 [Desulfotomaculaceae bacterium]|nr:hypothetical protein [Desulfotomaculaceae bacterium]